MESIIAGLSSGVLVVALIGAIRFFFKLRGKELSKPLLRWLAYGLAVVSTAIIVLFSKEVSFATPETIGAAFTAAIASTKILYDIIVGKLNIRQEG